MYYTGHTFGNSRDIHNQHWKLALKKLSTVCEADIRAEFICYN